MYWQQDLPPCTDNKTLVYNVRQQKKKLRIGNRMLRTNVVSVIRGTSVSSVGRFGGTWSAVTVSIAAENLKKAIKLKLLQVAIRALIEKTHFDRQWNLGSISLTFYAQLLQSQIPKVQKRQSSLFAFLGSSRAKAVHKMLMKLTL